MIDRAFRDGGEVDMGGDVLQANQKEGIIVRVVAVVAHQGAGVALRMVILARAKAVIDEQHGACFKALAQAADQAARCERNFAEVIVRHHDLLRKLLQCRGFRQAFFPKKIAAFARHAAFKHARI